jgi:glutamate racemase
LPDRPIGIFDSGVGGLSVACEVQRALPSEHIVYVADAAHCPYGDRAPAEVRARALAVGAYLERRGVKLLVVACNTATGAALEHLRSRLSIGVIGLEPAVKTGARLTRNGRVGVMATVGTLASPRFARLVETQAVGVRVIPQPCPGLADLIERGELEGSTLEQRLLELTAQLREADVDTVVLGCTHYPFIRRALAGVLGPRIVLVDSGAAIARRATQLLSTGGLLRPSGPGSLTVLSTGESSALSAVVRRLLGEPIPIEPVAI